MEPGELFNAKKKPAGDLKSTGAQRYVGLPDDLVHAVWTYGFRHNLVKHNFEVEYRSLGDCADLIRDGITDLGIISSVDLARIKESLQLIPGMAVSTQGAAGQAQLFFRSGLKDISQIAVQSRANTSLVLLKILMREKYASNPGYLVLDDILDNMLLQADAALIVGTDAVNLRLRYANRLDLGEEWTDLTGLPFVFSIFAGRNFLLGRDDIEPIIRSFGLGQKNLENICKEFAENDQVPWSVYHDFLTHEINYRFSEIDHDGLNEFYNYAFFFGYIDQIPDIRFINKSE